MYSKILCQTFVLCLLPLLPGWCKAIPSIFGRVTLEELTEHYYKQDSTAGAAILSDVGKSYIVYDQEFKIRHTREVRIKIYSRQALDKADISIPYYTKNVRDMEVVRDIEAYTYNIEHGMIARKELDKHAIYDNKISDKWSEKVFALPDVREGSVIEYRYTVISPFLFNLRDWQFQYDIPVKWSAYEVKIPSFYEYQMLYQGFQTMEINESEVIRRKEKLGRYEYQNVRYKWALKDIPAFQDESFITTEDDYIAKMIFQLSKVNYPGRAAKEYMTTWPKLIQDFLRLSDFGKNLKKNDGEETLALLTQGLGSDMEKATAIYQYVNSHLAWNGKYSIYPSKSPKKVLEDKNGNCTDVNLILNNMLNMAGIKASPVLLSTRDHGHVNTKFPLIDEFNYALVYTSIDSVEYLLDATDRNLPLGMIPIQCINGYGLVMTPEEEKWVTLYRNNEYNVSTYAALHYDTRQEKFIAQVSNVYRGYAAAIQRKKHKEKPEMIIDNQKDIIPATIEIIGMDDIDKPLNVRFEMPYAYEKLGEYFYLDASVLSHFYEHPFKSPERNFPIDYGYARAYRYTFILEIPEGYVAEEYPTPETISLEDNSVQFVMQTRATSLNIQLLGIVRINYPMIEAKHYQKLRELYSTMLNKYAEKIVLRKADN